MQSSNDCGSGLSATLTLEGELDASRATEVVEQFNNYFDRGLGDRSLAIDGSKIEFIDAAMSQVLWAVQQRSHRDGGDLKLVDLPGAVADILQMSGFQSLVHNEQTATELPG